MAPPPDAIQKAEAEIVADQGKIYRLIPSKTAIKDAALLDNTALRDGDIPLFVADRLAFAGNRGPQLPLFLENADCRTSYDRLRQSSSRLPETPNIRTTTLMDVLESMEKGTRPGVSQLSFYSSAEDLVKATDLMTRE
jgi:Tic22-like family